MPQIRISAYLPVSPSQAFTHVTAFPAEGQPNTAILESKYGTLESTEGSNYTFQDREQTSNRWLHTFEPPSRREILALDSNWSDRVDTFEPYGEGTAWTITWAPKSGGAPFLLRWLLFRLKDRKTLYQQIMQPVVEQLERQEFY